MPSLPVQLLPGDRVPWFRSPALNGSPAYAFDTVGGRYVVMLFFGSAEPESAVKALATVQLHRALFDDVQACFFGITVDPQDALQGRIRPQLPGIRYFLDYDRTVSALYGAAQESAYRPHWLVLDPGLRVLRHFPLAQGENAMALLRSELAAGPRDSWAPVLLVPNLFEPELCGEMIRLYQRHGGDESGFMRDVDGKTVFLVDASHKRRRDCVIDDEALRQRILARMKRRLNPAIAHAFQFNATRIERYLVACYDESGGYFRPHRDNTTKGTAHRQFAVTINLNAEEYEGGDLRFPEFGMRTYRAPTGGAVVFSCSLLHEAMPVIRGRRFAFLPFLYDDEAARLREANNPHLGPGVGEYRMVAAGPPAPPPPHAPPS